MMYSIHANLHNYNGDTPDVLLYDSMDGNVNRAIVNISLSLEVNKAGSMTFDIYPQHPMYSRLVPMKTSITVYKIVDGEEEYLWDGRVYSIDQDISGRKKITVEGALAYLMDSVMDTGVLDVTGTDTEAMKIFGEDVSITDILKDAIGDFNLEEQLRSSLEGLGIEIGEDGSINLSWSELLSNVGFISKIKDSDLWKKIAAKGSSTIDFLSGVTGTISEKLRL